MALCRGRALCTKVMMHGILGSKSTLGQRGLSTVVVLASLALAGLKGEV